MVTVMCFPSMVITGDGKSQYIHKKLEFISSTARTVTLTINESFSMADAIRDLRQLPLQMGNALYLNFTLLPASVSHSLCNPNSFYSLLCINCKYYIISILCL